MPLDLGDVWAGKIEIRDTSAALANAGSVTLTITLPDGTTTSPSVSNDSTGIYSATYQPLVLGRLAVRWVATGTNASTLTDVIDVSDPAALPIVSLDEVRDHMGWSSPTTAAQRDRDERVRAWAAVATELAEDYCGGIVLGRRSIVETHDGGYSVLLLRRSPTLSVTSITEDGTTVPSTSYRLDSAAGMVWRTAGLWGTGYPQSTVVTYVAGYASPPRVARWAVLRTIEEWWTRTQQAPHPAFGQSGSGFDEFAPSQTGGLPYAARVALDPITMPAVG